MEHQVILDVLKHKGFSEKWVVWVKAILCSGTSSVLLNGVPGKSFKCKRGVRQGDPLSPLLFVLAADLLQYIINRAASEGNLQHPLSDSFDGYFPIVQYADDTLLFLPVEESQILYLKQVLHQFASSTGLKVNFSKSFLVPINVSDDRASSLVASFECQVGSMPFTYLGLPLGTTRPSVQDFLPLISRIERRLMGLNTFLSYAGRLVLMNSVLSSLPTFYLCTLKLPISVIEQIDKYMKHFLWDKGDINIRGGCLVSWRKACLAKDQGGLGIIDLRAQNTALLVKFLDKFYNHANLPWVHLTWQCFSRRLKVPHVCNLVGSFWWRDVMSLSDNFLMVASCKAHSGLTCTFWKDSWDFGVLHHKFPQLFYFVRDQNISIAKFLTQDAYENFHAPLSVISSDQLQELVAMVQMLSF
jgi:hypothetical protein